MPKTKTHKRGGSYFLRNMTDVTTWSGVLLDRRCLNELKIDDIVRVIFDTGETRYIKITNFLSSTHMKGFIRDPYRCPVCNYCKKVGYDKNFLYMCDNVITDTYNECDFHIHKKCLNKIKKSCSCKLIKVPFQNGETIIFKKNNISEIPNWTKNTKKINDIYKNKNNIGYFLTGTR